MAKKQRLDKAIAMQGSLSRSEVKTLIRKGAVTVNGQVVKNADFGVDFDSDTVAVQGKELSLSMHIYLMLNKPRGYVTTLSDELGRATAAQLVADCGVRVFPVGRLDKDSEGLLLFTNDGALMQAMTHPRHQVDKTYEVTVSGTLDGAAERLSAVDELDGEPIVPAQVTQVWRRGGQALLLVTIHQGKNRQIRRMCAKVDLQVMRLRRIAEDTLTLGSLPPGQWRYLTEAEVSALKGSERE